MQLLKSECEKISDYDDDVLLASTAIIISSVLKVREFREQQFWIQPSLQAKKKCSTTDLMKDLVLNDLLNLKYRLGAGFKNFFHVTTSFDSFLNIIGPRNFRCDTRMRS